jgi:hypothetical protein
VVYANGWGPVSTGITCAVKRLVARRDDGLVVADAALVMPQRGDWSAWGDSTFVRAAFERGRAYQIEIAADPRTINMSAFAEFARYTGGAGGASGELNRVNIAELKVLSLVP